MGDEGIGSSPEEKELGMLVDGELGKSWHLQPRNPLVPRAVWKEARPASQERGLLEEGFASSSRKLPPDVLILKVHFC